MNTTAFAIPFLLALAMGWAVGVIYLRHREERPAIFIFFFTVFYIYLIATFSYTLGPFSNSIEETHVRKILQVIPFKKFDHHDLKTSFLNILLGLPFGFGLPFFSRLRFRGVVFGGAIFSASTEMLQLLSNLLFGSRRIADINDLFFNTLGSTAGYLLFLAFAEFFRLIFKAWNLPANPVILHIVQRPQISG